MLQMLGRQRWVVLWLSCLILMLGLACSNDHLADFGESCKISTDCKSTVCVGGEAGVQTRVPFCSEDCTGKQTGDECANGAGKCISNLTRWCWVPCTSDSDCQGINAQRGTCGKITTNGTEIPFKVCVSSVN
ncbi:MAG: hypothetical protein EP343_27115 [Deltaproteobacteria bacterium]|nr:MAG: hypothetical protein EP343_27115 [Deltaproteobacteria bacterium]